MGTTSIRLATAADAEQIRSIYNYEVMHTTATFDLVPRSLADQQEWLAARSGAFAAIVAVDTDTDVDTDVDVGAKTAVDLEGGAGQVVGFGALSPYKERAAYRTSVENSVYVRSDCQGRGIGRLLLQELLNTAELSGFHAVFARINASPRRSRRSWVTSFWYKARKRCRLFAIQSKLSLNNFAAAKRITASNTNDETTSCQMSARPTPFVKMPRTMGK